MKQIEHLIDRIIQRVNTNLHNSAFDVGPYIRYLIPPRKLVKFYAFYGVATRPVLTYHFQNSNLAGSYFLGRCSVDNAIVYKSDIRGDELKVRGDVFQHQGIDIVLHEDEMIHIQDSFLVNTLVHNYSHDPENLETFGIRNTVSAHFANIHGSPVEGSFLGPFSTIDFTTVHDCVIGPFAYVQAGELSHREVEAGTIWIRQEGAFNFLYRFPPEIIAAYVKLAAGQKPGGIFIEFIEAHKKEFQRIFDAVHLSQPSSVHKRASLSRYSVFRGQSRLDENVLVAQRAYLDDAWLGAGANAQENCYILSSRLAGRNVTAHGAKIIHADLGEKVFVGFNAFLRGRPQARLRIGEACIVMPHTIIDLAEPMEIPPHHLVWGYIRNNSDLQTHALSFSALRRIKRGTLLGAMIFEGSGERFLNSFQQRIEHILTANGAYFDGKGPRGHAQNGRKISFNLIQPYTWGPMKGLYPSIDIRP